MRIWNVPCHELDSQHLLGEYRELNSLWPILVREVEQRRTGETRPIGDARHPESSRWRGRLGAILLRHEEEVAEMIRIICPLMLSLLDGRSVARWRHQRSCHRRAMAPRGGKSPPPT